MEIDVAKQAEKWSMLLRTAEHELKMAILERIDLDIKIKSFEKQVADAKEVIGSL